MLGPDGTLTVPKHVRDELEHILTLLQSSPGANHALNHPPQSSAISSPTSPPRPESPQRPTLLSNVRITKKTILSQLYRYLVGTDLEYPETSEGGVGHLFELQPGTTWGNPTSSFAYSLRSPRGYTLAGKEVEIDFLGDGSFVPCRVGHATCQGSKICPMSDLESMSTPHTTASRALLQERLRLDRENRMERTSPSRDIFKKTAAVVSAFRRLGCTGSLDEINLFNTEGQAAVDEMNLHRTEHQRGYSSAVATCDGRLQLECEHYSSENKDHLVFTSIADGSYDMGYLEALFNDDLEEIKSIEGAASTVCNVSVQKTLCRRSYRHIYCSFDHRDSTNILVQHPMIRLECKCVFRTYEPLEEYRDDFPFVLIVSKSVHPHPIPLPSKTPPKIRAELMELLPRFQEDLPDLTPRRFLRHPILKAHLSLKFPDIPNPTLTYIDQMRKKLYPHGTRWKGILGLKDLQIISRPLRDHCIRQMVDIDIEGVESHVEDDPVALSESKRLRFILCMTAESSERLLTAQYVQSDIAFRRVVGFYEFELGAWERDATTSVVFCRIFLNRQTAVAHLKIFQAIEDVLFADTGKRLRWRHIHGLDDGDFENCLLQWMGDQHGGQAKGLGLHLQAIVQKYPHTADLHDPTRKIASLAPYEHLYRTFRLCVAHGFRNIRKCKVPGRVRELMRSLICVEHEDWDATVEAIRILGGKAGTDWVNDKERSQFAFQAMCWAKSSIPKLVWCAGDRTSNLIETSHADVNREGVQCTILGGIMKGEFYDSLQMKTLRSFEQTGIRQSYSAGHPTENAIKNLKRKCECLLTCDTYADAPKVNIYQKGLMAEDLQIWNANSKIQQAHEKIRTVKDRVVNAAASLARTDPAFHPGRHEKQSTDKARGLWKKEVEESQVLVGTGIGSGRVCLVYSTNEID
ncbi:hypothetical protein B0H16DRAFT_1352014 [Mycena metata]|uniref:Uncharacterized protein n=1 Tax=Mycena metata TaxID=1033252 RepID=A0AAD7DLU5_9AGAR|nr:hypothetical protein B0H16DRAFT_1352014 [Mycena metata]